MNSAVLFLVFNRPETTRRVFETIRAARPKRLYVAADGPREMVADEGQVCEEVRDVATRIDWDCELKTLFRERNLGCKEAISKAIDWFFEYEEEGIILEDDTLPLPTFFPYCDELLTRFRDDSRVGMIGGCNFVSAYYAMEKSYDFSSYNIIWGWATWRRSWKNYDVSMKDYPSWIEDGGLQRVSRGNRFFERYWRSFLDRVHSGDLDTWDYQWTFAGWKTSSLNVIPSTNLIRNIGFGDQATFTRGSLPSYLAKSAPSNIAFPLRHPESVQSNAKLDSVISKRAYHLDRIGELLFEIKNVPGIRHVREIKRRLMN